MIVSITHPTSRHRRQRWTFALGPVSPQDEGLTFILDEYAVEVQDNGRWSRPKHTFYSRRRGRVDALMPLAEVPTMDDTARQTFFTKLLQTTRMVAQGPDGLIRI